MRCDRNSRVFTVLVVVLLQFYCSFMIYLFVSDYHNAPLALFHYHKPISIDMPKCNVTPLSLVPNPDSQCDAIRGWEHGLVQNSFQLEERLLEYNLTFVPWPNFSPTIQDLNNPMTDLGSLDELSLLRIVNMERSQRHNLNFVLNPHLQSTIQVDSVPLLLRVYKRLQPLDTVLDSICVMSPNTTLIISIDEDYENNDFTPLLKLTVQRLHNCVFTRVFWHSYIDDCRDLQFSPCYSDDPKRLNAHFWSVHYLGMIQLKFRYVISIEDDLYLFPDFYNYHL